jgi:hypothetical protein
VVNGRRIVTPTLTTRLTREYRLRYPFVSAGMGFIAHPALAAAVSNAGGLGVLGAPESHVPARRWPSPLAPGRAGSPVQ